MSCRNRLVATLVVFLQAGTGAAWPAGAAEPALSAEAARNKMVDEEVIGAGVKDPRVIDSMRKTPRHEFVPAADRKNAYFDMALPIGSGQTISPPVIVAFMTEQLEPEPTDSVLEIGTGSGYQAAVLSPLVDKVYSIEIVESLGRRAAAALKHLKYKNVFTKVGDGYQGWAEHAPFDKIIVTCSPENVPQPLVDQLKEGGRMIVPLGERYQQTLYLFKKQNGKLVSEALRPTLFVPMTGAAEDQRRVKPDPLRPGIVNGGFEESSDETGGVVGWHYPRQMEAATDGEAREGKRYVTFHNAESGRGAQALQAFGVDGRKVTQLDVSAWVRAKDIQPAVDQLPMVAITFYDERRATVGVRGLGPWRGTFDWRREHDRVKVPPAAREAIVGIGLLGATGALSMDDLSITAAAK
ncbi:MAG: protein-L-isoaspartate(D-aspartate) O-methyltransferase [Planctomycetia bacterium]|nr:protein-L-isoaspartate(D-aspartate) O-methyltransferase [Planctomycetia bacterium]